MEWINKNGVEILKDNPNYEVLGSVMYVGMYAFYYNGVENKHFYNISSAKKYAEEFYNCKKS
jgi:hypothetical protein